MVLNVDLGLLRHEAGDELQQLDRLLLADLLDRFEAVLGVPFQQVPDERMTDDGLGVLAATRAIDARIALDKRPADATRIAREAHDVADVERIVCCSCRRWYAVIGHRLRALARRFTE
jgi:hypothetical protein